MKRCALLFLVVMCICIAGCVTTTSLSEYNADADRVEFMDVPNDVVWDYAVYYGDHEFEPAMTGTCTGSGMYFLPVGAKWYSFSVTPRQDVSGEIRITTNENKVYKQKYNIPAEGKAQVIYNAETSTVNCVFLPSDYYA